MIVFNINTRGMNSEKISKQGINIVGVIVVFTVVLCTIIALRGGSGKDRVVEAFDVNNHQAEEMGDSGCVDCVVRKIDGVPVEKGLENLAPVAVMLDNHYDARPAHSLARANLVIEAEAEGGITRYLAVFAGSEKINEIGPVRSARPYFVDWANELSALYVHCGGSPGALAKIVQDKIVNLNEFYNAPYFWRTGEKMAPHNILTSTEKLNEYLNGSEISEGDFEAWSFAEDEAGAEAKNTNISIPYKYPYNVEWQYNQETGLYERYLAGAPHKDHEEVGITAKNIIIQYAETEVIDEKLRLDIKTIDNGRAVMCKSGHCIEGEWRKRSNNKRTMFYNENREEYVFSPGTTWIEVVRSDFDVDL